MYPMLKTVYPEYNWDPKLFIGPNRTPRSLLSDKEYINKIVELSQNLDNQTLSCLKQNVRENFLKGPICNYKQFVEEFENKLIDTYKKSEE